MKQQVNPVVAIVIVLIIIVVIAAIWMQMSKPKAGKMGPEMAEKMKGMYMQKMKGAGGGTPMPAGQPTGTEQPAPSKP